MKQSTEELKKILAGAKSGDVFYDGRYLDKNLKERHQVDQYTAFGKRSFFTRTETDYINTGKLRSLSDIKEIVELLEKLDSAFVIDSNEDVTKLTSKQLGIEQ